MMEMYEVEVVETVTKVVRVCADSPKQARSYVAEQLDWIDMEKDIDGYKKGVGAVHEYNGTGYEADYTVPEGWRL